MARCELGRSVMSLKSSAKANGLVMLLVAATSVFSCLLFYFDYRLPLRLPLERPKPAQLPRPLISSLERCCEEVGMLDFRSYDG